MDETGQFSYFEFDDGHCNSFNDIINILSPEIFHYNGDRKHPACTHFSRVKFEVEMLFPSFMLTYYFQ